MSTRVCAVPALDGFSAQPASASYYGTAAFGGAAGGPAGTSSMLFFCLIWPYQIQDTTLRFFFGRTNLATQGWGLYTNAGNITAIAYNSTPAAVSAAILGGLSAYEGARTPYLAMASYQNGVLTLWLNGIQVATTTLGAGFTSYAGPTTLGIRSSTGSGLAVSEMLSDHGMLTGYDVSGFTSPIYGNGAPGLAAQWLDDLRNGKYLTWPRSAVANADWYWAARDAVLGSGTILSWVDRYSATAMTRIGNVQAGSFPARAV